LCRNGGEVILAATTGSKNIRNPDFPGYLSGEQGNVMTGYIRKRSWITTVREAE
jgi:hypothetical protein